MYTHLIVCIQTIVITMQYFLDIALWEAFFGTVWGQTTLNLANNYGFLTMLLLFIHVGHSIEADYVVSGTAACLLCLYVKI
jgi:hypothetical protein